MSRDVFMAAAHLVAMLILASAVAAQSPPTCPADRPIDDVVAEMNKQKPPRNKNPLPDTFCIDIWAGVPIGRCRDVKKKPPEESGGQPSRAEAPAPQDQPQKTDQASSAKTPAEKCNEAMERTLEAAHDIEVGDESFSRKNYKGALLRYQDAAELKPDDAAIHVRVGRAFEQLNQRADTVEQYKQGQHLGGPEKYLKEANAALARLQHAPQ